MARWIMVDAEATRARLQELVELGNSVEELGEVLGVTRVSLGRIISGQTQQVRDSTAKAVAGASLEALGAHELAEPLLRRLQALACLGHSQQVIADEAGLTRDIVARVQSGFWRRMRRPDAAAVREVYERLSGTVGESRRTSRAAEDAGWVPPSGWTAEDLDDYDPATTVRVHVWWSKQPHAWTDGERLRRARVAHDFTPAELCSKLGCAVATYKEWEGDRRLPSEPHLSRLREVLGWSPT